MKKTVAGISHLINHGITPNILFTPLIGNIRKQDILDIWKNSENFKAIRDLSNTTTDQIPYCKNCDYNPYCNAGCRADAYVVHGDLKAPDPFCPYWRKK
jgi:radical SAM protein with 4Fe4S-binding SPASM domain